MFLNNDTVFLDFPVWLCQLGLTGGSGARQVSSWDKYLKVSMEECAELRGQNAFLLIILDYVVPRNKSQNLQEEKWDFV